MRCAARTPEPRIDQRKASAGEWNQKNKNNAEHRKGARESRKRSGRWRHPYSPRGTKWASITRTSPTISTPTPARTKAARGPAAPSSMSAANTSPQPASNNRKPRIFMQQALGTCAMRPPSLYFHAPILMYSTGETANRFRPDRRPRGVSVALAAQPIQSIFGACAAAPANKKGGRRIVSPLPAESLDCLFLWRGWCVSGNNRDGNRLIELKV